MDLLKQKRSKINDKAQSVDRLHRQRGQAIVEAILILVILLGISRFVAHRFQSNELIKKLVSGPWLSLDSMIQNGVWDKGGGSKSKALHPNYQSRHITVLGDPMQ